VTFDFKKEVAVGPREVGFIAEEVENVSPLLVGYLDYVNENNESVPRVETVKYEKIAVVLTKAIQEQQKEITSQREEIGKLREANTKQDAEIKTLRESIQHLQQQMR
jgi:predicted RNase H-like nuclease (RuvC/YqgF family)